MKNFTESNVRRRLRWIRKQPRESWLRLLRILEAKAAVAGYSLVNVRMERTAIEWMYYLYVEKREVQNEDNRTAKRTVSLRRSLGTVGASYAAKN
jgi:hypothetical protein